MFQKKRPELLPVCLLLFSLAPGLSCEKAAAPLQGPSKLEIYLDAAPTRNYNAVEVDIRRIMVTVSSGGAKDSGWTELPLTRAGRYNLLDFTNGVDTLVASARLPEGSVSKMRLTFGNDNALVLRDGNTVPLSLPQSLQDGLDLTIVSSLTAQGTTRLVLEFDAARSVVASGKDHYTLSPVARVFERSSGGTLEGIVLPDSARAWVVAVGGEDTLTALPDFSGFYKIRGMKPRYYQLTFRADTRRPFVSDTIENVLITGGQTRTLDTVWLQKEVPVDSTDNQS